MKTFRLLAGVSCLAMLACPGLAAPLIIDTPASVTALSRDELGKQGVQNIAEMLYVAPSLSVLGGGANVKEFGGGIKLRGIGDPRFNLSIEGSAGLYEPGGAGELWLGGRYGYVLGDDLGIEIVGNSSVGLIGGTPSYRFGIGGEIPVLPAVDVFAEATFAGHFGSAPTDNGIRGGIHFFPGLLDLERIEVLKGPQGTLYGDNSAPALWVGGSLSAVPSASRFIPAVDGGIKFKTGTPLDIGLKASIGYEVPAGDYSVWAGVETGLKLSTDLRAYLSYELGSIGGFSANKAGIGLEYKWDPHWSVTGELSGRGAPGSFSEGVFKTGLRYTIAPESEWDDPIVIETGPSEIVPYIGKSISGIPSGGIIIPALDLGLDFEKGGPLVPGLRAQLAYQHPAGVLEAWMGGKLAYELTPEFAPYVAADIGTINFSGLYNRIGLGAQYEVAEGWYLNGELFSRGAFGGFTESGIKVGVGYELAPPPP